MSCFAPCPACNRHVATDETACPFCSASLPDSFRRQLPCQRPPGRLSRAAMVAAGVAMIGAEGCWSGSSAYGVMAPYDAGMGTGTMDGSTDGGADGGVAAAASLEQAPPDNGANPPARKKT